MSNPLQPTRRGFLKFSAAAAAVGIFAPNILRAEDVAKKLNFAGIGVGGKGASDIANASNEMLQAHPGNESVRCLTS